MQKRYTYKQITKENDKRNAKLDQIDYNPITGKGSLLPRFRLSLKLKDGSRKRTILYLPHSFKGEPIYKSLKKHKFNVPRAALAIFKGDTSVKDPDGHLMKAFYEARSKHDFEFWAITKAHIQDKITKKDVPFRLRYAQQILLGALEKMRMEGVPIRIILVKARQWGGSTLVQIYMAWIQLVLKESWHSTIVADVEDQARNIRSMYSRLLKSYPTAKYKLEPFEGSTKNKEIRERKTVISIGSSQKPESLRSTDIALLHMSEVGLWQATANRSPEDLAQSIRGALTDVPDSLCVMESTAKGVGSFFHREFQAAEKGESNYRPVFIAWFEIDMYRWKIDQIIEKYGSLDAFVASWNDYEKLLWKWGATIEGIAWYRYKLADFRNDKWRMQSEYPSNAQEAFQSTGHRVIPPGYVQNLRETCKEPIARGYLIGDAPKGPESLKNIKFIEDNENGNVYIWKWPEDIAPKEGTWIQHQTAAWADIGGRAQGTDRSVVTIIDRKFMMFGGQPEVVCEYAGNLDQDLFAWDAARLCTWYHEALLAVETNSLRHEEKDEESEGDQSATVLDEIKHHYPRLFKRVKADRIKDKTEKDIVGFHTNASTKEMIIKRLIAAARDKEYIERCYAACDEMDTYERKKNNKMGAVDGKKDDRVMSRAGTVWLALSYMDPPVTRHYKSEKPQPVSKYDKPKPKKASPAVY